MRGIVSPVFLPDADLFVFTYYEVDERCLDNICMDLVSASFPCGS